MYDHAIEEMVAAGVAEPLDKPTWQDQMGALPLKKVHTGAW